MNIDDISWEILRAVQKNGRISIKSLAGKIGLSVPATSERLKRLEEAGIIEGYRATILPKAVGYDVMAVIGMTTPRPDKARLVGLLTDMPEVIECLHITGQDSYLLRVVAKDMMHLETFIESINKYGETRTSLVMSQPIPLREIQSITPELKPI